MSILHHYLYLILPDKGIEQRLIWFDGVRENQIDHIVVSLNVSSVIDQIDP